jgi:hypothetical protein
VPARKKAKKKAARPARSRSRSRSRKPTRTRPEPLKVVSVGDAVKIPAEARNLIGRYDAGLAKGGRGTQAIEGIVASIRRVATGELVVATKGDIADYVLEIVHNETFLRPFSSDRNTGGPRGPETLRANAAWNRVGEALRQMAGRKRFVSTASGRFSEEPFESLLDGWRVVKVRASLVEPLP